MEADSPNEDQKPNEKSEPTTPLTPKPEDVQMVDKFEKQFKMLGFTSSTKVPRAHFIAGVDVILPQRGDANERAFAAMVKTMLDTGKVMIAKIVERANAEPKLVVLYPHIEDKQPLLYLA